MPQSLDHAQVVQQSLTKLMQKLEVTWGLTLSASSETRKGAESVPAEEAAAAATQAVAQQSRSAGLQEQLALQHADITSQQETAVSAPTQ